MPHCERWLYHNFLSAQIKSGELEGQALLDKIILIANRMDIICQPLVDRSKAEHLAKSEWMLFRQNHSEKALKSNRTDPYWIAFNGLVIHRWKKPDVAIM